MITQNIEMLRVRIERTRTLPLILAISAVLPREGKAIVASALAQSMAAAGHRTLLVLADGLGNRPDLSSRATSTARVSEHGLARSIVTDPDDEFDRLVLTHTDARLEVSRDGIERFYDLCRAAYGVTIIETATALATPLAMLTASSSDGILLTIREGRRVKAADRSMAETMTREALPFLGVVAVNGDLLKDIGSAESHARVHGKFRSSVDLAGQEQQAV